MANVNIFRGGSPVFRGIHGSQDFPEWQAPFDAPHFDYTPPFDSHADGVHGQGYLNLMFPLVPRLAGGTGHDWMTKALRGLSAKNDIIRLAWVPLRSYVESMYIEVTKVDPQLKGVYVVPVAERVVWNFATNEVEYKPNTAFDSDVAAYGSTTKIPLGSIESGDSPYFMARFPVMTSAASLKFDNGAPEAASPDKVDVTLESKAGGASGAPSTFGHNLVKYDEQGKATEGLDESFGAVMLGLKISEGDSEKIANLFLSDFALYFTAKVFAFECSSQIG